MRIRKSTKPLYGVGIKGDNPCTDENGGKIISYRTWASMIERAHSAKYHAKRPTYIGCSVSDEWLYYDNYKKWFDANYKDGSALDKDLLVDGNKMYGPTTCRFVPQPLNNLFLDSSGRRGQHPMGVYRTKQDGYFQAHLSVNGKKTHLGTFHTSAEAHTVYLSAKKSYSTREANRYLANGDIEYDLYLAVIRKIANLK